MMIDPMYSHTSIFILQQDMNGSMGFDINFLNYKIVTMKLFYSFNMWQDNDMGKELSSWSPNQYMFF